MLIALSIGLILLTGVLQLLLETLRMRRRQLALSAWSQLQRSITYWSRRDSTMPAGMSVIRSGIPLRPWLWIPRAPEHHTVHVIVPVSEWYSTLTTRTRVRPGTWPILVWQSGHDTSDTHEVFCLDLNTGMWTVVRTGRVTPRTMQVRRVLGPQPEPDTLPAGTRCIRAHRVVYRLEPNADVPNARSLVRERHAGRMRLADRLYRCTVRTYDHYRDTARIWFMECVQRAGRLDLPVVLVFNNRLTP